MTQSNTGNNTAPNNPKPRAGGPFVMILAHNVGKTLAQTYAAIPDAMKPRVVVGDNRSADDTVEVAKRLGLRVITHDKNEGYGGNLKRLFKVFIEEGCDVAIEVHGDYQYEPGLIDLMYEYVARGHFDMIQGNRIRTRREALAGGMHLYRWFGNRFLTFFQNIWFGTNFGEWHSGMRAYSRELILAMPLDEFDNTHAFASDIMMEAVAQGFRVAETPCPVRYEAQSSSVNVPNLFKYAFRTVWAALRYPPWRIGRKRAAGSSSQTFSTKGAKDITNGTK